MSAASAAKRRDPDLDVVALRARPLHVVLRVRHPVLRRRPLRRRRPPRVALPRGASSGGHRHARPHRGPRHRSRPPGPHGLRALRAARDRGRLRRARHRDRGGARCRRRSRARRRRRPRAPSTPRSASARGWSAGRQGGGHRRRVHRPGDGGEPRRPRHVGHRDRPGRPGDADPGPRHGRPRPGRRRGARSCDSCSRRRSRRSCSTRGDAPRRADERGRAARRPRRPRDRRPARRAPRRGGGLGARATSGAMRVDDHQRCPDVDGV